MKWLTKQTIARRLGTLTQILLVGSALFLSFISLHAMQSGARIFRYAGF